MLVSVNRFLDFIGKKDCQVKLFKIQRNPFRKKDKELTKEEYNRLILAAKAKSSSRLFLMIQAICSTGIRVSEHRFITREALERGRITIYNKGKERVVFLPKKLKNACSNTADRMESTPDLFLSPKVVHRLTVVMYGQK